MSNDYIYCVGGVTTVAINATAQSLGNTNLTYYAPLTTSGIGTWVKGPNYPVGNDDQTCDTHGGYIYCVGGWAYYTQDVYSYVYYANVTSSGFGSPAILC